MKRHNKCSSKQIIYVSDFNCRSRNLHPEGLEDSPASIFEHARGEYPAEETQDGEVLLMSDDQAIRRVPQSLRFYKIMVH
jgi:hypothetical protein